MMANAVWIGGAGADGILGWLLTYAVHSTILLGAAVILTMRLIRSDAWRETLWRAALIGGMLTSTLQLGMGMRPLTGEWRFAAGAGGGTARIERASLPPSDPIASEGRVPELGGAGGARRADHATTTDPRDRSAGAVETVTTSRLVPVATGGVFASWPAWSLVFLALWAIGALLLLVRLVHRQLRLHRLLRGRHPVTEGSVLSALAALRRNAGVWRPVELTASPICSGPLALGASEICVPERFLWDLDLEQQRSALAHELAHLARRDPGWHLLSGLVEALFFFQPLNRVARLRLREAAEHLSDDWAVRQTGSPLGLARCLAEVASWVGSGTAPVAAGTMAMAEGGSPLLQRVERLLGARVTRLPRGRVRTAAAVALLLSVLVGAPVVSAGGRVEQASANARATGAAAAAEVGSQMAGGERSALASLQPSASRQTATSAGAAADSRALSQERVIRHGAPSEPLDSRWRWAAAEAERRGDADYWVAYAFERRLPAGRIHIDDSASWSTAESHGVPLGTLVYGPSYERLAEAAGVGEPQVAPPQAEASAHARQPVLVLFHMVQSRAVAARVGRVSLRTASAGMDLRGAPLYWLGPASDAQSFDWLRGRIDDLQDVRLQGTVVGMMAMHEGTDRVVAFLEGVIASDLPTRLRKEAVEGLAWHATNRSVALLRATALEDHASTIRKDAAETLGQVGVPAALAALDEVLRVSRSDGVREEAVEALARWHGPEVLEILVRVAMQDPHRDVREEAVEAIATFPASSAVPALDQIAQTHARKDTRREAVEALGEIDPAATAEVLEQLLQRAAHSDVRAEVLEVVAKHRSPRALAAIFQVAMTDPDPELQGEAVEKLGELDPVAALPRLEQLIWEHPRREVREEAVEALAELPVDIALPALDEIVAHHEDGPIVRKAVEAIAEFPSDMSMPRLQRVLREHPRRDVRREALDRLADMRGSE